ncbi:MAG TPA: DNA polymerase III subunit alpha [Xanthobacteraceae bacterium]|nr:DNA polymerase III subunit alpha [Xanthobacteraceae bacterium]
MSVADFIHLHTHSAYSLSTGAIKVKELTALCKLHRMPAVAMTDTGNLFGALEFALAARDDGVQPIVGCELAIRRADHELRGKLGKPVPPEPVVLLVQDETGYRNLLALVSASFLDGDGTEAAQIDLDRLERHAEGLILLTGGPAGPVGRLLNEGQAEAAAATLGRLAAMFPGRLYVELMRHNMPEEDRIETALIDLAYAQDLPLVATNNVYFNEPDFYEAHDVLLGIADGMTVSNTARRKMTPQHYFKSPAEMRLQFVDLPEACDNTLVIAQRCAFMPEPRAPILPPFPTETGDEKQALRAEAAAGLERRLAAQIYRPDMTEAERDAAAKPYRERLDFELGVIESMGFAGYFLIVAEFIQWAKSQGIPVGPGRGSGAGSVVAWSLTITDVDPLRFGLVFERFLNPERVSMPDFDVDFCQDRRDEVIRHVQEKYGADRVAQIITFGTLQARAVLRDVGRVLEMPYGQVDRICKLVPYNPAAPIKLQQAIEAEPLLEQMRDNDEQVARLIEIATKLEGLYRHASTHAAGVVIGDRPLQELVPLYRDPRSALPATQFNLKYVETAGLVKFDFLGLTTLTIIAKAVELLAKRGVTLDLAKLPLDDKATFELLGRGDTVGVFQFEGAAMRDLHRKLKPNQFEDLIAIVSLYRPGPMDDIPEYIACKQGTQQPDYLHPSIRHILEPTYGVMTYQEQVLQIARVMGGYTFGGADLLRRAMGKKIKSEMEAQRKRFIDGAKANGVSEMLAEVIFEKMAKFAGYGFNKSHAAPYALIAYQTAYLKANYPVEYIAAFMTYCIGNTDKLNVFRQECDRLGIKLLPPDVNKSDVGFVVEDTPQGAAIRYALAAVKGVGAQAMGQLVAERAANGPFKYLFDLAQRLDIKSFNKRQFESLAKAGAFDALNRNRAQTFAAAELLLRHAASATEERVTKQVNLFGDNMAAIAGTQTLPPTSDWLPMEKMQQEFEAIGFYLSSHPLEAYGKSLERLGVVKAAELTARVAAGGSTRYKIAGVVVGKKERNSARGNRFAFVQLSDQSGMFEATLFQEQLSAARPYLDSGSALLLSVDVREDGDSLRITAQSVEPLDQAVAHAAAGLRIRLGDAEAVPMLAKLMAKETGGKGRVSLVVPVPPAREVEIVLPGGFKIGPSIRGQVQAVPGVLDVHDI